MAKFRQITRTIEYTEATIMCVNIETQQISNVKVVLSLTYETPEKVLREAEKVIQLPLKAVSVVSTKVIEKLYGMPETMFIKLAMPIEEGKNGATKEEYTKYFAPKTAPAPAGQPKTDSAPAGQPKAESTLAPTTNKPVDHKQGEKK